MNDIDLAFCMKCRQVELPSGDVLANMRHELAPKLGFLNFFDQTGPVTHLLMEISLKPIVSKVLRVKPVRY